MNITIVENAPASYGPIKEAGRKTITSQDRDRFLRTIREYVISIDDVPPAGEALIATFDTGFGKTIYLKVWRHGKTAAAIWFDLVQEKATPVAVSAHLLGINGADDIASIESLRNHNPSPLDSYTELLALNRPVLWISYFDGEWIDNRLIELGATSLFLACISPPTSSPKMEPRKQPTEEEVQELDSELNSMLDVFKIIQNDWATRKILRYTVIPSEIIADRAVEEIMHVKFWVGVQGHGRRMGMQALISLFLMLADYKDKLPGLSNLKEPRTKHTISLDHSYAKIASVLKQISISEPN